VDSPVPGGRGRWDRLLWEKEETLLKTSRFLFLLPWVVEDLIPKPTFCDGESLKQ
jgi:hypothetical protein